MLLEILATLAAGLFAGAAIYIDLAEQPARKHIDITAALTEWRPSYKRAAVVQPVRVDGLTPRQAQTQNHKERSASAGDATERRERR